MNGPVVGLFGSPVRDPEKPIALRSTPFVERALLECNKMRDPLSPELDATDLGGHAGVVVRLFERVADIHVRGIGDRPLGRKPVCGWKQKWVNC